MSELLWAVAAIGFIGTTFWFAHAPAPSIAGDHAVPTTAQFHLWRGKDDADGTYRVYDDLGHLVDGYHVRDNRVSELPGASVPPGERTYHGVYERDFYVGERTTDLGVWTGYARFGGDNRHWQTGARYSPLRLLYGTISTDLALSQDAAGFGISLFPPADYLGRGWEHLGLGAWYLAPFDGGAPGLVYGLSFSIH